MEWNTFNPINDYKKERKPIKSAGLLGAYVLKEELTQITEQKKFVLNELSNYSDLLDKTLVLKKSNGIYQYYYRDADDDLEYIPAADKDIAKRLAQKDYYEKMRSVLKRVKKDIKNKKRNRYKKGKK